MSVRELQPSQRRDTRSFQEPANGLGLWQRGLHSVRKLADYCIQFGCWGALRTLLKNAVGKTPLVQCRVRGVRTAVFYRRGTRDFAVLREVFGHRAYDIRLRSSPRFIIDGGANVGYVSLFFANRYPDARIIAVEPDPANCEVFRMNCGTYPQITLVQAALWPRHATLAITNPDAESWAFRVGESDPSAAEDDVKAVTLMDLVQLGGASAVDLLKLDIEGAEKDLFSQDCRQWLPLVKTIIAELHDRCCPGCSEAFFKAVGLRPYRCEPCGEHQVVTFV